MNVQFWVDNVYKFIKNTQLSVKQKGGKQMTAIPTRRKIFNAVNVLKKHAYTEIGALNIEGFVTSEPLPFERRTEGKQCTVTIGSQWAQEVFDCAWFHVTGKMPQGADLAQTVLLLDFGGEGLVYDKNGVEKQGITCGASQFDYTLGMPVKRVVYIDGLYEGEEFDFWVDAGANDLFGNMKNSSKINTCCVARRNAEIRALAYDAEVLLSTHDSTADADYASKLLAALSHACRGASAITEVKATERRAELAPFLAEKNSGECFEYYALGHAHLDLAWLWPIRESYRKCARTFSNQLLNIKLYDGYIFGASQAQQYDWAKEKYPRIYSRIREEYERGRWDLQGATWVEMDSNLIGGESMIRQFFYGKQFYLKEFGEEMKIFWVPDSFGYSACIPQVMKLANVPYFLTQKMSWNTVNMFPYHTFNWKGLDGSEVFAHMLPENTYNGPMTAECMTRGEQRYRERKISNKAMMLFGIGDGGGGPGFEHLERGKRYADLKGVPKVIYKKSLDFFRMMDDKTVPYPTHSGELYLEKHQGTYTTQSKNKKYNRKCEFALKNYELLMSRAIEQGITPPIEKAELDVLWKEVLLYQFHDILPGSSINRVYVESVARYEALLAKLDEAIRALLFALYKGKLFNFAPFGYTKRLKLEDGWYTAALLPLGASADSDLTPYSEFKAKAEGELIENDCVSVRFAKGLIVSVKDKRSGAEFIDGAANLFSFYRDTGDCWDIPRDYASSKRNAKCIAFSTYTDGAKAVAKVTYQAADSVIEQEISIIDGSALITFDTKLKFCAEKTLIRVAFPLTVKSEECNFNVQFGHIARKTTENDSVEKAQYEVSGQKFVDLSDGTRGISLINDCKYGYRCKGSVIDMTVIRAPKHGPGKHVDQGEHSIIYALLPHEGALSCETYKEAYLLNNPPRLFEGSGNTSNFYATDNENVVLETVKPAEDGDGIIARFYNCSATAQTANATLNGYLPKEYVDIMEANIESFNGLTLHGFQLVNVRYVRS